MKCLIPDSEIEVDGGERRDFLQIYKRVWA